MARSLPKNMENTYERNEKIENAELRKMIVELKEVDTEIAKMVEESEDKQREFDSKIMVRQKIVDMMKPVVNTVFVGKLGEFEEILNITISEEEAGDGTDTVNVKISDRVEEFKAKKRNAKEINYATAEENAETIAE